MIKLFAMWDMNWSKLLQHRLVLDYLPAQTGGYCLTLETKLEMHCCNYITNDTSDPEAVIDNYMNKARNLKENFQLQNYDKGSEKDYHIFYIHVWDLFS